MLAGVYFEMDVWKNKLPEFSANAELRATSWTSLTSVLGIYQRLWFSFT